MLYREIIAVCSQIHTKHINTLCGQNVELLNVKLAEHNVTSKKPQLECLTTLQEAIRCVTRGSDTPTYSTVRMYRSLFYLANILSHLLRLACGRRAKWATTNSR
jgi:hypothetical protein